MNKIFRKNHLITWIIITVLLFIGFIIAIFNRPEILQIN